MRSRLAGPRLRAAPAPAVQVIDPEGTRLIDLAARAATTKQEMSELVGHLDVPG
ncbi:hypothetical protein [Nocardia sp. NPDC051463]|uniref:hypothetical protein n=1 Tax=Nocardia sp. NPDC051463 TaxID=3154845 RepID=UPI00344B9CC5